VGLISVAERLLEVGEVNFAKLFLRVVKPTWQFHSGADDTFEDSRDDDDDDDDDADDDSIESDYYDTEAVVTDTRSVIVSNIPKSLSEDYLRMFLENSRRSGGGEITDVQLDQKSATAVVTFADPQGNDDCL